ncbi:MAG TPA: hypothetical protein VLR88_00115 [Propionibacteriaceae bacterium]|nr:hypothetical protein [Propionibacteriaceae bacterium]
MDTLFHDFHDNDSLHRQALPASEVRRLGTRRRTRRVTGLTAGALGLTLVAGGIAFNSSLFGATDATPDWAATPTVTTPVVTIDRPTWANVPTGKEIYWDKAGDLAPSGPDVTGLTGVLPSACMGDPGKLGATTTLVRRFDGGTSLLINETVVVLGFDSTADATKATSILNGWYAGCEATLRADGASHAVISTAPEPLDLGDAGDAVSPSSATYHSLLYIDDRSPEGDGHFEDVVVAQLGDRIVWTTAQFDGNENNCYWSPDSGAPLCHVIEHLPEVAGVVTR